MTAAFDPEACDLDDFRRCVEVDIDVARYPSADGIREGAVAYSARALARAADEDWLALRAELVDALQDGPGVVVISEAFDADVVDRVSAVFRELIAEQRQSGTAGGDHFAESGANDRVWNSLEKLARRDPAAFVDYHDNPATDLVSRAWVGDGYQLTAQVNVVNPGGRAQAPHRDYHLGFLSEGVAASYPPHVHRLSPYLTLQGAVAHTDMPVATGPTMYLPHSQKYDAGYVAWRRDDFAEYFAAHRCQPALAKGDAVFFNPALFHAAGHNTTGDQRRMANLFQVSSPFGRAMEKVDRRAICLSIYPALLAEADRGRSGAGLDRVVSAAAEGYPFPADLDHFAS